MRTPSRRWLGQPMAILPTALDGLEELLAAGPSALGPPRALTSPQAPTPGVRVISIEGPIMTGLPDWLAEFIRAADPVKVAAQVRAAALDPDVTGIVLMVNSPGGAVSGVDDAATAVREAAAQKPVIAFAPDLMASAAYWIASGATSILTSSTGLVGSIGTYMRWMDMSAAAEQAGVRVHVYRSAPGKAPGQPGEPHNEQVDEAISSVVEATNAVFIQSVAAGRGLPVSTVEDRLATGRIWVGEHAVTAGVADQLGTFADALALADGSPAPAPSRPPARSSPARAETSPGDQMTPEQLAALGLQADATPAQIMAAITARNQAKAQLDGLTGRFAAALGLTADATLPADPLAALTTQAADGRAYREAQLDRIHALTIVTEGNSEAGIQAADDAREVYSGQSLERINAQITRLEAKRDSLPAGPVSKQPSDKKPANQTLDLSAFGLKGRR